MIRVPDTSQMDDVTLGKHMDLRHAGQAGGVKWKGEPVSAAARRMWEMLHQRLHRMQEQEHQHDDELPWNGSDMPAGLSLLEKMWEELDGITDRLVEKVDDPDDRGRAQGVAWCIALFTNPYNPDVEQIKREAMRRRQGRVRQ